MSNIDSDTFLRCQLINEIANPQLSIEEKAMLVKDFNLSPLNCSEIAVILNVSGKSIEKFLKRTFVKSKKIIGSLDNIQI